MEIGLLLAAMHLLGTLRYEAAASRAFPNGPWLGMLVIVAISILAGRAADWIHSFTTNRVHGALLGMVISVPFALLAARYIGPVLRNDISVRAEWPIGFVLLVAILAGIPLGAGFWKAPESRKKR